jgi:outer membrane receptor protein involved in Fe transport
VVLGVRGERDSLFGYVAAPRVAGMVYLAPEFRLLVGGGMGYRAPDFNELYLERIPNPSHPPLEGNPDLQPEHSWGGNIGGEYATENFFFQVSAYYTELFNEIVYAESGRIHPSNGLEILQTDNVDRSMRTGVDLEGRLTFLGTGFVSAGYSFFFGYDRSEGERLRTAPAHTAKMKAGAEHKNLGLYYHIAGNYYSPLDPDSSNENYTSHRYRIDLFASLEIIPALTISLAVENVTGWINTSLGPYYGPKFTIGVETEF